MDSGPSHLIQLLLEQPADLFLLDLAMAKELLRCAQQLCVLLLQGRTEAGDPAPTRKTLP